MQKIATAVLLIIKTSKTGTGVLLHMETCKKCSCNFDISKNLQKLDLKFHSAWTLTKTGTEVSLYMETCKKCNCSFNIPRKLQKS